MQQPDTTQKGITTKNVLFYFLFYGGIACLLGYGWYQDSGQWWPLGLIALGLVGLFFKLFYVRMGFRAANAKLAGRKNIV